MLTQFHSNTEKSKQTKKKQTDKQKKKHAHTQNVSLINPTHKMDFNVDIISKRKRLFGKGYKGIVGLKVGKKFYADNDTSSITRRVKIILKLFLIL